MNRRVQPNIDDVIDALERIMNLFKYERILYLIFGLVSLLLFVYAAARMFSSSQIDKEVVMAMLGASGTMAACSARVVFFLNRAFAIVEQIVLAKLEK
jgi:hypothetical protein